MPESGINKGRKVKLWCPSVSKMVAFVAGEEQRLDLGSLSRLFGLDPSTLKLNGHFISRGVDLVSSSVTWRSLLNYFSAKGLSTGKDDSDALVVDGKLCKAGTKRACDPQEVASRIFSENQSQGGIGVTGSPQLEDVSLLNNKKLKDSPSGCGEDPQVSKWKSGVFKRKQLVEDVRLLKKLKLNEAHSDFGGKDNSHLVITTSGQLACSCMDGNLKRTREEKVILASPCKRIR